MASDKITTTDLSLAKNDKEVDIIIENIQKMLADDDDSPTCYGECTCCDCN